MSTVRSGRGWRLERDGDVVRARFDGVLDRPAGEESAAVFEELTRDLARLDLVFEVGAMDGYETAARKAWQSALMAVRRRVRSIRTIGANPIVRMGASTLGMLAGIPVDHA